MNTFVSVRLRQSLKDLVAKMEVERSKEEMSEKERKLMGLQLRNAELMGRVKTQRVDLLLSRTAADGNAIEEQGT